MSVRSVSRLPDALLALALIACLLVSRTSLSSEVAGQVLPATAGPVLSVSPDGRFMRLDGKPWYWVGDTAWTLHRNASREDLTAYLEDRAARGVRIIQGPILVSASDPASYAGFITRLPSGRLQLRDPGWTIIDHAVREAGRLGMIITISPVWGPDNATFLPSIRDHAAFAGLAARRYHNQAHVLWIVAGEYHKIAWQPAATVDGVPRWTHAHTPEIGREAKRRYTTVLEAISRNANPRSLIVFHADGWKYPSRDWQHEPRVAANLLQPGGHLNEVIRGVAHERAQKPVKPVINAEADYEGEASPATLQRQYAWHTAFSAAAGFTYGNSRVWSGKSGWKASLQDPGSTQVFGPHLQFMRRIHREQNQPAEGCVANEGSTRGPFPTRVSALRSRTALYVYTAVPQQIAVRWRHCFGNAEGLARWVDPRTGFAHAPFRLTATDLVHISSGGPLPADSDWILEMHALP